MSYIEKIWNTPEPAEREILEKVRQKTLGKNLGDYFILDPQHNIIKTDLVTTMLWKAMLAEASIVKKTTVNDKTVSTVFLEVGRYRFETMVFGFDWEIKRTYNDFEEAVAAHDEIVKEIQCSVQLETSGKS